jgi:superkiller protein 3
MQSQSHSASRTLSSINVDPENLAAITTLAGMGIVSGDATLVDAALSEILSLPPQRRAELDPSRDVTYLLAQHQLAQGNVDGALEVYREAVEAEPDAHALRRQLVALILQHGEPEDALRATVVETESLEDVREMAAVKAIATSVTGHASAAKKLAHKAVMLTPWASRNWEALAFIGAQPPGEDEEDEDTEAPKAPIAATAA